MHRGHHFLYSLDGPFLYQQSCKQQKLTSMFNPSWFPFPPTPALVCTFHHEALRFLSHILIATSDSDQYITETTFLPVVHGITWRKEDCSPSRPLAHCLWTRLPTTERVTKSSLKDHRVDIYSLWPFSVYGFFSYWAFYLFLVWGNQTFSNLHLFRIVENMASFIDRGGSERLQPWFKVSPVSNMQS